MGRGSPVDDATGKPSRKVIVRLTKQALALVDDVVDSDSAERDHPGEERLEIRALRERDRVIDGVRCASNLDEIVVGPLRRAAHGCEELLVGDPAGT